MTSKQFIFSILTFEESLNLYQVAKFPELYF